MRTEGVLPDKITKIRLVGQSTQDQLEIHLEDSESGARASVHAARGDSAVAGGGLRSSPRLQAMRNATAAKPSNPVLKKVMTTKRKMTWGTNLRLPVADEDDDFMESLSQKRRCLAGDAGPNQQLAFAEHVQAQPNEAVAARVKKSCPATRCSPKKFREFVDLLSGEQKHWLDLMGFGGLLSFKPKSLDRDLLMWLMEKLNPETMRLEISGGKEIDVTKLCVLGLPSKGGDPPIVKDTEGHIARELVARHVFGIDSPKVEAKDLNHMLICKQCDDDFAIRCFFIVALNLLLFPNTDSYIKVGDDKWIENLDCITGINWCKALIDNLRFSARLWRDKRKANVSTDKIPICGCGIFLNILYVDNLLHGIPLDAFQTPRCTVFDSKLIEKIAASDARRMGMLPRAMATSI